MISIVNNKKPDLNRPSFNVDKELHKKLNDYEITKLMNKSHMCLFLGPAGSGKTSLCISFLATKNLFHKVYNQIFIFIPATSRASINGNFFDKKLPKEQIFDNVEYEDLLEVYETIKSNSSDNKKAY
jgi:GTPase SAR1 family protein